MAHQVPGWPMFLVGTLLLRWYVFVFLAVFLVLAGRDLGWRRAFTWLGWGWAVAFVAEYTSSRTGIPFGLYHYTGETVGRELFVSNVPLFDSLSFPFLAYASFCLARGALGRAHGRAPAALAGALMMLLDVVVDPLAVLGDRWFLGRVFYYAEPGLYFGVPLSNFAGWFLVGWAIAGGYLWAVRRWPRAPGSPLAGVGLYYGILLFNLAMTGWIGERTMLGAGILVHVAVFLLVCALKAMSVTRGWTDVTPAKERGALITSTIEERGS